MPVPGTQPDADGAREDGGLMRGTGATLRSGRVRVFARRMVVPEEMGGRGVVSGRPGWCARRTERDMSLV